MTKGLVLAILLAVLAGPAAAHDRLTLDGELVQGGLVLGIAEPGAKVTFNGRQVRVSDDGGFLIGFGRDAKKAARLEIVWPDGKRDIIISLSSSRSTLPSTKWVGQAENSSTISIEPISPQ